MAKAVTNSLPHRPPFFSVFKKWLCEVYRRFGTETSPVVSLNYLLLIGNLGGNVLPAARFLVVIFFVVRAEFEASVLTREETQYAP